MSHNTSSLLTAAAIAATILGTATRSAQAGPEPYLSEIMFIAGPYCPIGWLPADGRVMSLSQNTALFSLLGTTYGGDGMTNFRLPRLRNQVVATGRTGGDKFEISLLACIAVEGPFPPRPD